MACGWLDDAERGFASTVAGLRAAGERGLAIAASHLLGQIQVAQGRLAAALGTCQAALEIAAAGPGRPAPPAAGIAYVGMAGVEYQRGELDAALRHVTEGIALLRPASYTSPMATGLATLAWIRQARGDTAGALEAIGEAEQVAPSPAMADLSNPLPAQRAKLLLAQDDADAAARWVQQRGLDADDEPGYPRERGYLVLARVLLAEDRPRRALALLERLLQAAVTQDRTSSVIEIQALRALALAAGGDQPAAVAALAEALTLACPQSYARVFADEGAPMRALLGRLIAAQRAEQSRRGASHPVTWPRSRRRSIPNPPRQARRRGSPRRRGACPAAGTHERGQVEWPVAPRPGQPGRVCTTLGRPRCGGRIPRRPSSHAGWRSCWPAARPAWQR